MFWKSDHPEKQLRAIFEWLSSIARAEDIIFVDFPRYAGWFYFDFPLHYGDRPKKFKRLPEDRIITFIIRNNNPMNQKLDEGWVVIFSSPEIEVFENRKRFQFKAEPLRWGLNEEERKIALRIARGALEIFLPNGGKLPRAYFSVLPMRFSFKTDLGVALWNAGQLRGSWPVENQPLGEGLAQAAYNAAEDSRFKPLESHELPGTRIEITIMSDLRIPLLGNEQARNVIYPEKGYRLTSGIQKGWFLPEVFNARRFRNLEEFLGDLAEEKAGLSRSGGKNATIAIFEVDDFIESKNHRQILALWGPVVRRDYFLQDSKFLIKRLRIAANWLLGMQESDGNIPPIFNPLTGRAVKQIDWPRLAFTAWALSEFGRATKEEKYIGAAQKSFEYLSKFLIGNSQFRIPGYELALAYFGQSALSLGKSRIAVSVAEKIIELLPTLPFEAITFSQIASFFNEAVKHDSRFRPALGNILAVLKGRFKEAVELGQPMNLAAWAELVNTFRDIDVDFSEKTSGWLKKQQLTSGAFPESTTSRFSYSRGTGKIFEVLALASEKNKEALARVLPWLLAMQYDEENTFFVPEKVRPRIIGAFRHDYFNHEAWIDAAGHILLGGARVIS